MKLILLLNLNSYIFATHKNHIDMSKETNNDRNAGRKPKYMVPTKLKRIPIVMEGKIDELLKPYLSNGETKA